MLKSTIFFVKNNYLMVIAVVSQCMEYVSVKFLVSSFYITEGARQMLNISLCFYLVNQKENTEFMVIKSN